MSIRTLVNLPKNIAEVYGSIGWDLLGLLGAVSILAVVYWSVEIWASGKYSHSVERGPFRSLIHLVVMMFVVMVSFGYGIIASSWIFANMWNALVQGGLKAGMPLAVAQVAAGAVYVGMAVGITYVAYLIHETTPRHLVWVNEYGYVGEEISREEIVVAIQDGHMSSFTFVELMVRVRNRTGAIGALFGGTGVIVGSAYAVIGIPSAAAIVSGVLYISALLLTITAIAAISGGIAARADRFHATTAR